MFINEKAKAKLKSYWKINYDKNIAMLLPDMLQMFAENNLWVSGLKFK